MQLRLGVIDFSAEGGEIMAFTRYHPVVMMLFFVAVIGLTMLMMHPIYLGISFVMALLFYLFLHKEKCWKNLGLYVVFFIMMAIINPLITQEGSHIFFSIGLRVVTWEATLYGLTIALMLVTVLLWFSCYNKVMTSDKFLYVFGKLAPTFALTVIITMRLVPRFQQQLQKIAMAQRAIGMDYTVGPLRHRLLCVVRILSILMTWALENAVETADAMKARGYGLPGKTTFSLFRYQRRDWWFLASFSVLLVLNSIGFIQGMARFTFYPTLQSVEWSRQTIVYIVSFCCLCSYPILIEWRERMKWRYWK